MGDGIYQSRPSRLGGKSHTRAPPKLTADQLIHLSFMVRSNCPNQLSFEFGLWTLRLIGELIEREFKVRLSVPTVGKVIHNLGFSAQRPLHRAWEQDAVLVQSWLQSELPALLQRAKKQRPLCCLPMKRVCAVTTTLEPHGVRLARRRWCAVAPLA
jgi:transposase